MTKDNLNPQERAIYGYLHRKHFATSADLSEVLGRKFGMSPEASRKAISRALEAKIIESTKPVSFGKRRYVYHLPNIALTLEFVLAITKAYRPPLYRTLSTMREQGGIISFYEILKIASTVLDNVNNHKQVLEKIVTELVRLDLVEVIEDDFLQRYLVFKNRDKIPFAPAVAQHRGQLVTDAMLLPDILRMLQYQNIIDNKNVIYRNKNTPTKGIEHMNHVWDAIAYTKTTGYNPGVASESNAKEKQTLVVLDVLLYRDYTIDDFQGFFERVQSVFQSVKMGRRKVLPIIVFRNTDELTFNTIHKVGFLTFNIGNVYGNRIYEVITNLNRLKSGAMEEDTTDYAAVVEDTLSIVNSAGHEDNLQNIRGDLFEFLLFPLVRELFPNAVIQHSIILKQRTGINLESYEYDFIVTNGAEEIVVVELKGYASESKIPLGDFKTKNTVKWFFGRTFPFAKNQYKSQVGSPLVKGVYITSASFTEDAVVYLNKTNESRLKPRVMDVWYDQGKLLQLIDKHRLQHVKDVLKKYFIK